MNNIYDMPNKSKKRSPEKTAVTSSKVKLGSSGLRKKRLPRFTGLKNLWSEAPK